jgi:hypothetical protein
MDRSSVVRFLNDHFNALLSCLLPGPIPRWMFGCIQLIVWLWSLLFGLVLLVEMWLGLRALVRLARRRGR